MIPWSACVSDGLQDLLELPSLPSFTPFVLGNGDKRVRANCPTGRHNC
jgi:hypothetical protein